MQSITSSEICALHLTHPSAHTPGAANAAAPGSSWGFGALLKGLTLVVDNSCRSRDSNPQPRVTSPKLYPIGHDCPRRLMNYFYDTIFVTLELDIPGPHSLII